MVKIDGAVAEPFSVRSEYRFRLDEKLRTIVCHRYASLMDWSSVLGGRAITEVRNPVMRSAIGLAVEDCLRNQSTTPP